jgi:hypothetical protein
MNKLNLGKLAICLGLTFTLFLSGCQSKTLKTAGVANKKIDVAAVLDEDRKRSQQTYYDLPVVHAKGIYLTGYIAGIDSRFQELVKLADETEINAMVIDIKDDKGEISYESNVPLAKEVGANRKKIRDLDYLLYTLHQHNIFPIARIVVFKDPIASSARSDLAVHNLNGGIWKDRKGLSWLDPYNKENWSYIADLSKEAIEKGFKEIQLDYIRFPSDGATVNAAYPAKNEWDRAQTIEEFLSFIKEELKPYNVPLSVDIFGLTTSVVEGDMGIGQKIIGMSERVDYICPMVYPSHYIPGNFGLKNPDRQPYETVYYSLKNAKERVASTGVKIRPWLQDFNLQSVYTAEDVRAQIKATYDNEIYEWILWNAGNRYTRGALEPEKTQAIGLPVALR